MAGLADPAPFAVPSIAGDGGNARRGARMDARASADQHSDVLSDDPAGAEKRRAPPPRTMRGGGTAWAPSLFGYFLGNAKK